MKVVGRFGSFRRAKSSMALVYNELGDPGKLVSIQEQTLPEVKENEIEVDMIAAPVNPSDINQIQGAYPIKPNLPGIGGNEGVGVVTKKGWGVDDSIREGDWVIPIQPGVGTWRTSLVAKADLFHNVPNSVSAEFAATLQVNPPTAYRMLKDFVSLERGVDTVIQNGANSGVGQAVIQLARAWSINTINVIRARPEPTDFDVAKYLRDLGATEVITEDFLVSHQMRELIKGYTPPVLALNCVGGKSSTNLVRYIKERGTLITYGGMSRQPVTIPTSALIFKEIKCIGYWNGMWLIRNLITNKSAIDEMLIDLCDLSKSGQLLAPRCTQYDLKDYKTALNNSMKPYISSKQLLVFNKS